VRRRITQTRLALAAHTHRTHLSRLEAGYSATSVATVLRLMGLLGVNRIYLRLRDTHPNMQPQIRKELS
jgi:transcriptional regulator with XRE-family HTH domain